MRFFHYRPQTKFAKVYVPQVSICLGVLSPGGPCLGVSVQGGFLSRGDFCPGGISVQGGSVGVPVQGGGSLLGRSPIRSCAGGMHPTGMHSCFYIYLINFDERIHHKDILLRDND